MKILTKADYYRWAKILNVDPLLTAWDDQKAKVYMPNELRREIQHELFGRYSNPDSRFYKWCIEHMIMRCEETMVSIPYPSSANVSHIVSRGADDTMRHDPRNINILSKPAHDKWEFGDRVSMRIYSGNIRRKNKLKAEYRKTKHIKI